MRSGILVHGSNHLIVNGPRPSLEQARKLIKAWEFPEIGEVPETGEWSIKTKEYREQLQWAFVLDHSEPHTEAVRVLLDELERRGVTIDRGPGLLLQR